MGIFLLFLVAAASAQSPAVPRRQIPPAVLAELYLLENRFSLALAADCDADRCFSKGCTYVDHAVTDQPRSTSLPGLGLDPGPGSVAAQEFLTRAQCAFAHEEALDSGDIQTLVRRLQSKLSSAWLVVSVDHQALQPLPPYLREAPEPSPPPLPPPAPVEPEPEPTPPVPLPEGWTLAVAGRELWLALLPHFFWMVGLGLVTLAVTLIIWAWRRVGKATFEEQALLAQLAHPEEPSRPPGEAANAVVEAAATEDEEDMEPTVAQQAAAWTLRLQGMDAASPDREVEALIRERLRAGDFPLLAKAMLRFPAHFPAAFPSDGELAGAKLELARYLQTVEESALPSDAAFFSALRRHALSATLSSQRDAQIVRSLREDFGTAGLVQLMGELPARQGALLFALAPSAEQQELVRLLSPEQAVELSAQLLRSNRMDLRETAQLFAVLQAARADEPLPAMPEGDAVLDRGAVFDAAGALSALLPRVPPERRRWLFGAALRRFYGSLPTWYREILVADMLLVLPAEARADLLLEVELEPLAAWLGLQDAEARGRLLGGAPDSLRVSVGSVAGFSSRAHQAALAERGRLALARGFQRQLARANLSFEDVFDPPSVEGP